MKTLWKSFKITIAFCIFFYLFYIRAAMQRPAFTHDLSPFAK